MNKAIARKEIFDRRYKNIARAGKRKADVKKRIHRVQQGIALDSSIRKSEVEITDGEFKNWLKEYDIKLPEARKEDTGFKQKINLGLLKYGTQNKCKSIIKDFLLIRLVMNNWRTAVIRKEQVYKFMSRTRMNRVSKLGLIKTGKRGEVWLVGQDKILEKLNIKDNRYTFLGLESLKNFTRTVIEVISFENQLRFEQDMDEKSKCVDTPKSAQKTYQRGTSLSLISKITGLSINTIQKFKDRSMWTKGKCKRTKNNFHFIATDGNPLIRLEDRFTGEYPIFYQIRTGKGYQLPTV